MVLKMNFKIKTLSKMVSSNEIVTLINAIGVDPKNFKIDDLRYGKNYNYDRC